MGFISGIKFKFPRKSAENLSKNILAFAAVWGKYPDMCSNQGLANRRPQAHMFTPTESTAQTHHLSKAPFGHLPVAVRGCRRPNTSTPPPLSTTAMTGSRTEATAAAVAAGGWRGVASPPPPPAPRPPARARSSRIPSSARIATAGTSP